MKTKKKALIIGLSIFGGCFVSAVFAAAFICTTPSSMTQDDYDAFEDIAFVDSGEHVNSYKTTFGDNKQTSEYEAKYQDSIKEVGEKLANFNDQQNIKDSTNVYSLRNDSDNLATIFVEDFMDTVGQQIENFFKQIKQDREKVHSDYKVNYSLLKKAYNNNVDKLNDTILDCERHIAELDKDDENYQYRVESYQYTIEITKIEIKEELFKYESDVASLNYDYESDLAALDVAEEQANELKENYEAQIQTEDVAQIEEIIEEVNGNDFEEAFVPSTPSIYREAKSVSLAEKEEEPQATNEAMVETENNFNADLFTFRCFDNCYLYVEPKDKESYWHF